ncbi:MAG: deoxyribodipyrimidine photolyase, partial [Chlorobiaceae bacterium]|nr:deoxyribodipyrimidine photolyase [Chlorobiaceae bacterium]
MVDPRRIALARERSDTPGPVVYWMSRDQRVRNNWALLFAQQRAVEMRQPLAVVFTLAPSFIGASSRHYRFMLKGLQEAEANLAKLNIPFSLLLGDPPALLPGFLRETGAGTLVTDHSPLKISRRWKAEVSQRISIPL